MKLREFLSTKAGGTIEIILFLAIAIAPLPMMLSVPLLIGIAIMSLIVRDTEWIEIGFAFKDFSMKKIGIGLALAIAYHYIDVYIMDPIISKFAPYGLPEIFSMQGNVTKLIIGLTLSWTTAAFFEEILFRGYLISRFIDVIGQSFLSKLAIIILTGTVFGFAHVYQGLNGAISAGIIGVFQAIVFFADGKKLAIPIIIHGAFDTIGFTLMFLG